MFINFYHLNKKKNINAVSNVHTKNFVKTLNIFISKNYDFYSIFVIMK